MRLIGRDSEVQSLGKLWSEVQRGQPRFLVLDGPPGIGKTFLAEGFLRQIDLPDDELREPLIGTVRCVPTQGLAEQSRPLWELTHQLLEGLETPALLARRILDHKLYEAAAEVVSIMPVVGGVGGLAMKLAKLYGGDADAEQSLRALSSQSIGVLTRAVILRAAKDRPVVLFVDDLHWSDPGTLEVLSHLMVGIWERSIDAPVMLVFTLRTAEAAMAVGPLLDKLTKRHERPERKLLTKLTIGALRPESCSTFVASAAGVDNADPNFCGWVSDHCGGNPLAMVDLVRALLADGLVVTRDGHLQPTEPLSRQRSGWVLPNRWNGWLATGGRDPSVRAVHAVLEALPRKDREILGAATVIGDRFTTRMLAKMTKQSEMRVVKALLRAQAAGVLSAALPGPVEHALGGTSYAFAGDRFSKALRDQLSLREAQILHTRAANVLDRLWSRLQKRMAKIETQEGVRGKDTEYVRRAERVSAELTKASRAITERLAEHFEKAGELASAASVLSMLVAEQTEKAPPGPSFQRAFLASRLEPLRVRAERMLSDVRSQSTGLGLRRLLESEADLAIVAGKIACLQDRYDLAEAWLRQAMRRGRWAKNDVLVYNARVALVSALYQGGNHRRARAELTEALQEASTTSAMWAEIAGGAMIEPMEIFEYPLVTIAILARFHEQAKREAKAKHVEGIERRLFEARISNSLDLFEEGEIDLAALQDLQDGAAHEGTWCAQLEAEVEVAADQWADMEKKIEHLDFDEWYESAREVADRVERLVVLADLTVSECTRLGGPANAAKATVARARLTWCLRRCASFSLQVLEEEGDEEEIEEGDAEEPEDEDELERDIARLVREAPLHTERVLGDLRAGIKAADDHDLTDERFNLRLLLSLSSFAPEDQAQEAIESAERLALTCGAPYRMVLVETMRAIRAVVQQHAKEAKEYAEEALRLADDWYFKLDSQTALKVADWASTAAVFGELEEAGEKWSGRMAEVSVEAGELEALAGVSQHLSSAFCKARSKPGGNSPTGESAQLAQTYALIRSAHGVEDAEEATRLLQQAKEQLANLPSGLGLMDDVLSQIADFKASQAVEISDTKPRAARRLLGEAIAARREAADVCCRTGQYHRALEELDCALVDGEDHHASLWFEVFADARKLAVEFGHVLWMERLVAAAARIVCPGEDSSFGNKERRQARQEAEDLISAAEPALAELGVPDLATTWRKLLQSDDHEEGAESPV
jgi:tetratricopeptide (TPR) repeat protein